MRAQLNKVKRIIESNQNLMGVRPRDRQDWLELLKLLEMMVDKLETKE